MPCYDPRVELDASAWSGEGEFTKLLIDALNALPAIRFLRVEDAPARPGEGAFSFISNELYVGFDTVVRRMPVRRLGFLPGTRRVREKAMSLQALHIALAATEQIGAPDYEDEGMLQYLRTERIIPPYQTRGYKLVELVRIYEVGEIRP
jgi:hypothetical protein